MAKQIIRLTESDLHRLVKESVRRILREFDGSGVPSTVGLNNDNSADSSFGMACNGVELKKNDPTYGRDDIAMNKQEKPIGHDGRK
jgi:hypothetical protein